MYNSVTVAGGDGDSGSETESVSAEQMGKWNKLIMWAKKKGYAGDPKLDHDEGLRKKVFDEYNKENPTDAIPIEMVKPIQNEIQAYKQKALNNIKANPASYSGKPETFMSGISKVDGIFGQLTSNFAFPEAYLMNKTTGEKKLVGFAPKVDLTALK